MIIYYSDNSLPESLAEFCRKQLLKVAGGREIISVSQKPIDFGTNICVGEIGRSYTSYYQQILTGVEACSSKYVATVEHDCLYAEGYFDWIPAEDDVFYYNKNVWYLDMNGIYSYYPRKAQSNMICNRELLKSAIAEKLLMTLTGYPSEGKAKYQCEPGVCDSREEYIEAKKKWCEEQGRQYVQYKSASFFSELPNIDIRHGANFTIPESYRRASQHTECLPYWGELCLR